MTSMFRGPAQASIHRVLDTFNGIVKVLCASHSKYGQRGFTCSIYGRESEVAVMDSTIGLVRICRHQSFGIVESCLQVQEAANQGLIAKLMKGNARNSIRKAGELCFIEILCQTICQSLVIKSFQQVLQRIYGMCGNTFTAVNELSFAPCRLLVCMPPGPNNGKHRHDRLNPCGPLLIASYSQVEVVPSIRNPTKAAHPAASMLIDGLMVGYALPWRKEAA